MNILIVGGNFDDEGGRSSSYITKFGNEVLASEYVTVNDSFHCYNGGSFEKLETILSCIDESDLIFWFANAPNDKEKLVRNLKSLNPRAILITSKNNMDGKYTYMDLVARALQTKSNLLVEFTKSDTMIEATILDPLCNCYAMKFTNLVDMTEILMARAVKLLGYTRIGSERVGEAKEIPMNEAFFDLIKWNADKFHQLIHGSNTSRFLGNASFRCEKGFPSMRSGDLIFVSKRNVDKRDLGANGFVACELESQCGCENPIIETNGDDSGSCITPNCPVQYYGDHKPSVDSPVQLKLYRYYTNINFMIHSHVYVEGAPFTRYNLPCGAIEEVAEILSVFPNRNMDKFAINLKGHGSLILVSHHPDDFNRYSYVARSVPEFQTV